MVTNYPRTLTADDAPVAAHTGNVLAWAARRVRQALCGLGGHDTVRHFEGKRVMMRCISCGHDTPGWEVADRGPRPRFEGDPRRHRLARTPTLTLRKSA
ncbi:MAG: hypothetical protein H0U94_10070 [Acidobacteria bacterium]|jgi:hypothetical protein|nr:hypothetical protein [Acidobacteriota bacterium]